MIVAVEVYTCTDDPHELPLLASLTLTPSRCEQLDSVTNA